MIGPFWVFGRAPNKHPNSAKGELQEAVWRNKKGFCISVCLLRFGTIVNKFPCQIGQVAVLAHKGHVAPHGRSVGNAHKRQIAGQPLPGPAVKTDRSGRAAQRHNAFPMRTVEHDAGEHPQFCAVLQQLFLAGRGALRSTKRSPRSSLRRTEARPANRWLLQTTSCKGYVAPQSTSNSSASTGGSAKPTSTRPSNTSCWHSVPGKHRTEISSSGWADKKSGKNCTAY